MELSGANTEWRRDSSVSIVTGQPINRVSILDSGKRFVFYLLTLLLTRLRTYSLTYFLTYLLT
jgi:hypothetical protein